MTRLKGFSEHICRKRARQGKGNSCERRSAMLPIAGIWSEITVLPFNSGKSRKEVAYGASSRFGQRPSILRKISFSFYSTVSIYFEWSKGLFAKFRCVIRSFRITLRHSFSMCRNALFEPTPLQGRSRAAPSIKRRTLRYKPDGVARCDYLVTLRPYRL